MNSAERLERLNILCSSGHMGRFGHEFLGTTLPLSPCRTGEWVVANFSMTIEFDFRVVGDGRSAVARYANNSNYRNDSLIRKESMPASPPGMTEPATDGHLQQQCVLAR